MLYWRCRLTLAQQELVMFTEKFQRQTQQISDYEYEISLLRKQIEALETEHEKDKKKISDLEELLAKAREVNTRIPVVPACLWTGSQTLRPQDTSAPQN